MVAADLVSELTAVIASGEAVLFTGAGFSAEAADQSGRPLPGSREMVRDLWTILFGAANPDDSSLADLYDVALHRAPDRLRDYLQERLKIGDAPLSETFAAWFAAPWRRIYTLNVDDLEIAVARQFEIPHRAEVIHLNGIVGDDPRELTFSTMQYALRVCHPDREYERLAADLQSAPFVFVGTTLDEIVLWQHVQLERGNGNDVPRRHSFLISPSLTRARRCLLEANRIHWLSATACQIAEEVLTTVNRRRFASGSR